MSDVAPVGPLPPERRKKYASCPHCGKNVLIRIEAGLYAAEELGQVPWEETLPAALRAVLRTARDSGLLAAFEEALARRPGDNPPPAQRPKFFVTWLRTMVTKRVPGPALRTFVEQFGGQIVVWGAQGLLGVTSNGKLVGFVPQEAVLGTTAPRGKHRVAVPASEGALREWVKTRYGYVPAGGMLLDELRRHSIGEFAR